MSRKLLLLSLSAGLTLALLAPGRAAAQYVIYVANCRVANPTWRQSGVQPPDSVRYNYSTMVAYANKWTQENAPAEQYAVGTTR
ncbi:MAG TPA: hypothetical protein VFA26_25170, partial [Gemmataceae bacterium]|nr:hypothetical protein [Gemmataceae bacterium]